MYAAKSWPGLDVIDIGDPSAPRHVASLPVYGGGISVTGGGDFLYLATGWPSNALEVIDISAPAAPRFVGEGRAGGQLAVGGDFVLAAAQDDGVHVLPVQCAASVGVPPSPVRGAAPTALFVVPSPNPASGGSRFSFVLPRPAGVVLAIHDVTGRRVRTIEAAELAAGPHEIVWDGRDDDGRALASGVYLARMQAGGETAVARVIRLR